MSFSFLCAEDETKIRSVKSFIFLILLISSFTQAQAQKPASMEANAVTAPKVFTILGKGVMDRKTGDSIALICVEFSDQAATQCKTISFAYFEDKNPEPREIGQRHPISDGDLEKTIRLATKELKKQIRQDYKNHQHRSNFLGILSFAGVFAAGGAVTVALNSGIPVLAAVGVWIYLYCTDQDPSILDPRARVANAFAKSGEQHVSQTMVSKDGWNWTVDPKVVAHSRFQKLVRSLR